ncbi:hypothetical protein [Arthrobacter sp. TMS2-4]
MITFALAEANLSIDDLWVRYYGLGGATSAFELHAYLSSLLSLPSSERNLVAGATNELLELTPVQIRVPVDVDDAVAQSGGDSRRELGAAGAFLFNAEEQEGERLAAVERTQLLDSPP